MSKSPRLLIFFCKCRKTKTIAESWTIVFLGFCICVNRDPLLYKNFTISSKVEVYRNFFQFLLKKPLKRDLAK